MNYEIKISFKESEILIEALSIAFLKTGAKKFDSIRSSIMNRKVQELIDGPQNQG